MELTLDHVSASVDGKGDADEEGEDLCNWE